MRIALKMDDKRWPISGGDALFERHRYPGDLKQSRRLFLRAGLRLKVRPKRCSGDQQDHKQLESFYRPKILHQSRFFGLTCQSAQTV